MAGIFGFLQFSKLLDGQETCQKLLSIARQGFNHPGKYVLEPDDSAGLGFSFPLIYGDLEWPLASRNGNFHFQLFGEIFLPGGKIISSSNFDEEFLDPFIQSPTNFLTKLDGAFVFAIYNRRSKEFILGNDPFGNFALHYLNVQKVFIFASQMQGIIKVIGNYRLDWKGIYEFVGTGYTLNGRTFYENINRLPAGVILKMNANGYRITAYSKPTYCPGGSFEENAAAIKEALIISIKNRLKNYDSVAAAVTGGFDSRITWGIIKHLGKTDRVQAFTHGLKHCRDIEIAQKIARYFRLNHLIFYFDEHFMKQLPEYWRSTIRLSEGAIPIDSSHVLASWEFERQHHRVLLDSHGGALFRRQFMKVAEKMINKHHSLADQLFQFLRTPLMNSPLLEENIRNKSAEQTISSFKAFFEAIEPSGTNGDKIDLFYIHQISALKYACAGNVQMNYLLLSHPFLTFPAFEKVQKVSISRRRDHSIYHYILDRSCPALKQFALENMGLPAPYRGFVYLRYFPMIYELVLRKSARWIPNRFYNRLSIKKFLTDYELFIRINFQETKDILLSRNTFFEELIHRGQLEKRLNISREDQLLPASEMIQLISLKLFCDEVLNASSE